MSDKPPRRPSTPLPRRGMARTPISTSERLTLAPLRDLAAVHPFAVPFRGQGGSSAPITCARIPKDWAKPSATCGVGQNGRINIQIRTSSPECPNFRRHYYPPLPVPCDCDSPGSACRLITSPPVSRGKQGPQKWQWAASGDTNAATCISGHCSRPASGPATRRCFCHTKQRRHAKDEQRAFARPCSFLASALIWAGSAGGFVPVVCVSDLGCAARLRLSSRMDRHKRMCLDYAPGPEGAPPNSVKARSIQLIFRRRGRAFQPPTSPVAGPVSAAALAGLFIWLATAPCVNAVSSRHRGQHQTPARKIVP